MKIPFAKVDCSGNELKYLKEVLNSGWLTTAGKTFEFEKKFADYIGAKYSCAVCSCTAALHLAVEAIGIEPGDKVFVPSMTFTATAEVIRYMGADPIFLDVEYGTTLITPEILEKGIRENPGVKALILVHYGGHPADMNPILEICRRNKLRVIEDAAHAFPTRYQDRFIGNFGDITCFSFYANKTITTGEGGMLVTSNEEIYKRAKIMRLHGINRDIWNRFTSNKPSWEYDVVAPGFKYNMPDIAAAIGLAQLERAEEFRRERQRCAEFYYSTLSNIGVIDLPSCKYKQQDHSWHLFPVVIKNSARIDRNMFIEELSKAGIGTSVHYKPLHRMTYYSKQYDLKSEKFPNSERIWKGTVSLPIYPSLTNQELKYITDKIHQLFE